MYEVTFSVTTEWKSKISAFSEEKKMPLSGVLFNAINPIFSGQATSYTAGYNPDGTIQVTVKGVTAFDHRASQDLDQKIAAVLGETGLRQMYYLSSSKSIPEPGDQMISPQHFDKQYSPRAMWQIFGKEGQKIPDRFLCPITRELMDNPAYLTSNRLINYESAALMTWIAEKHTDPSTRSSISAAGVLPSYLLQQEIYSFVMDVISDRDLRHYFSEKLSLEEAFKKCNLKDEAFKLAAKALRRAANKNFLDVIETILKAYPTDAEYIINIQDENPESKKTALHYAVANKNCDAIRLLREAGAALDIPDASGKTAAMLGSESEIAEIREIFSKIKGGMRPC